MKSNDVRLQMLRNAYPTGQMLNVIDLQEPAFEPLAVLDDALDASRVEACANSYHGDSWIETAFKLLDRVRCCGHSLLVNERKSRGGGGGGGRRRRSWAGHVGVLDGE